MPSSSVNMCIGIGAVAVGRRPAIKLTGLARRHWMNRESCAAPAPVHPLVSLSFSDNIAAACVDFEFENKQVVRP